ncbi:MAG: glycan-binding surface protein [Candidatus Cyclobacteriaceae bacterium M3_2C_046]
MKTLINKLKITLLLIVAGIMIISCNEDDEFGTPAIENVRMTNPDKADSSLTGGQFGQLIVIQGRNLGSTQEIYFNTEQASFNPNYITNENIIVNIPGTFPEEVTNQIRVVTLGGQAIYNFNVAIPLPVITSVGNEFAAPGMTLNINGDYFYNVEQVMIGEQEAKILKVTPENLSVEVPQGVSTGTIKVTTVAGTGESAFNFRDPATMIMNFDDVAKCWGGATVEDQAVNPTSGNYAHVEFTDIPAESWWNDAWVVAHCGNPGLQGNASEYALKFEVNVPENWLYGQYEISLSWNYYYHYKPWEGEDKNEAYKTKGWKTVTIPLDQFKQKVDGAPEGEAFTDVSGLSDVVFNFQNPGPEAVSKLNLAIDNIRIVRLN